MSWNSLSKDYESASDDIRVAVARSRKSGTKTVAAFYQIARVIGMAPARVRTLFFREGTPRIDDEECDAILNGVIRHHRQLAARLRAMADEEDMISNNLETRKMLNQLSTSGETIHGRGVDRRKTIRRAA